MLLIDNVPQFMPIVDVLDWVCRAVPEGIIARAGAQPSSPSGVAASGVSPAGGNNSPVTSLSVADVDVGIAPAAAIPTARPPPSSIIVAVRVVLQTSLSSPDTYALLMAVRGGRAVAEKLQSELDLKSISALSPERLSVGFITGLLCPRAQGVPGPSAETVPIVPHHDRDEEGPFEDDHDASDLLSVVADADFVARCLPGFAQVPGNNGMPSTSPRPPPCSLPPPPVCAICLDPMFAVDVAPKATVAAPLPSSSYRTEEDVVAETKRRSTSSPPADSLAALARRGDDHFQTTAKGMKSGPPPPPRASTSYGHTDESHSGDNQEARQGGGVLRGEEGLSITVTRWQAQSLIFLPCQHAFDLSCFRKLQDGGACPLCRWQASMPDYWLSPPTSAAAGASAQLMSSSMSIVSPPVTPPPSGSDAATHVVGDELHDGVASLGDHSGHEHRRQHAPSTADDALPPSLWQWARAPRGVSLDPYHASPSFGGAVSALLGRRSGGSLHGTPKPEGVPPLVERVVMGNAASSLREGPPAPSLPPPGEPVSLVGAYEGGTSVCRDCPVRCDLWLCLVCGDVRCGRTANGHSEAHYKQTHRAQAALDDGGRGARRPKKTGEAEAEEAEEEKEAGLSSSMAPSPHQPGVVHRYAIEVGGSMRVWDYEGDGFVHRVALGGDGMKLLDIDATLVTGATSHHPPQPAARVDTRVTRQLALTSNDSIIPSLMQQGEHRHHGDNADDVVSGRGGGDARRRGGGGGGGGEANDFLRESEGEGGRRGSGGATIAWWRGALSWADDEAEIEHALFQSRVSVVSDFYSDMLTDQLSAVSRHYEEKIGLEERLIWVDALERDERHARNGVLHECVDSVRSLVATAVGTIKKRTAEAFRSGADRSSDIGRQAREGGTGESMGSVSATVVELRRAAERGHHAAAGATTRTKTGNDDDDHDHSQEALMLLRAAVSGQRATLAKLSSAVNAMAVPGSHGGGRRDGAAELVALEAQLSALMAELCT